MALAEWRFSMLSIFFVVQIASFIADFGEAFTRFRHSAAFGSESSGHSPLPDAIWNVPGHTVLVGPADADAKDLRPGRPCHTETGYLWPVAH